MRRPESPTGLLETQLPQSLQGSHLAHRLTGVDLGPRVGLPLVTEGQKTGGEGRRSQQADNQGANGASRAWMCPRRWSKNMHLSCRLSRFRLPFPEPVGGPIFPEVPPPPAVGFKPLEKLRMASSCDGFPCGLSGTGDGFRVGWTRVARKHAGDAAAAVSHHDIGRTEWGEQNRENRISGKQTSRRPND